MCASPSIRSGENAVQGFVQVVSPSVWTPWPFALAFRNLTCPEAAFDLLAVELDPDRLAVAHLAVVQVHVHGAAVARPCDLLSLDDPVSDAQRRQRLDMDVVGAPPHRRDRTGRCAHHHRWS
jgi:hypothetical protein